MAAFEGLKEFRHDEIPRLGVLLTNLGTPDAPTPAALRRYLGEFLSDPRVVEIPRLLWWPVLHGILLRTYPRRSAKAYEKVWTERGSPLLANCEDIAVRLQDELAARASGPVKLVLGMRYGNPSLRSALESMRDAGVRRLLVLPLYPQYASSTTASTVEAVNRIVGRWRWIPEVRHVTSYHDEPAYIAALADSLRRHRKQHGSGDRLMFSFHGIPRRNFLAGDPYHCQCHKTARLVAEALGLEQGEWQVCFQSRFGKAEWLQPYTDRTLEAWGREGLNGVDVICPGFPADCLETLEEIAIVNAELFRKSGGGELRYVPALNADAAHVRFLGELVAKHSAGWPEQEGVTAESAALEAGAGAQRARRLGADR
jgi:protoporphyrin/coproporphyrin ferrochelatase